MSDLQPAAAPPSGGAPPAAPNTAPPADQRPLLGGAPDASGDDGAGNEPAAPASWRDDWREALAGEDEAFLRQLKRYSSPENFAKADRDLRTRQSKGLYVAPLPDNPTEDEIAAHRKAAGIPDKPDGYGLAFPDTVKPTEADTAVLGLWGEYAHSKHLPPGAAKIGAEFFAQQLVASRAAQEAAAHETTLQGTVDLRTEYGLDFKRNLTLADEFLAKHGTEKAPELMGLRLADGRALGNHPDFIRMIVAAARATADDDALVGGDGAGGGKSVDDEYQELIKKNATPGQKLSPAENARLNQLAGARVARSTRRAA